MSDIRPEILTLAALGTLPAEGEVDPQNILEIEKLYRSISRPVTDDEASVLVSLLGNDGCFGLAYSFVHLIETAPGWPIRSCLEDMSNEWIRELVARAQRAGKL